MRIRFPHKPFENKTNLADDKFDEPPAKVALLMGRVCALFFTLPIHNIRNP